LLLERKHSDAYSETHPLHPVMATWDIRSKTCTSRRRKTFLPSCCQRTRCAPYLLVEDRTLLRGVHFGQEWSAKDCSRRYRERGACSSLFPRKRRGFAREARWRNPRVSVLLSPTLTLFLAPHGKLYLKLQELVPESESVRLAASPPPKTMASSIEIPDATLPATDFSNGYPK
jgi:hypothetical protein